MEGKKACQAEAQGWVRFHLGAAHFSHGACDAFLPGGPVHSMLGPFGLSTSCCSPIRRAVGVSLPSECSSHRVVCTVPHFSQRNFIRTCVALPVFTPTSSLLAPPSPNGDGSAQVLRPTSSMCNVQAGSVPPNGGDPCSCKCSSHRSSVQPPVAQSSLDAGVASSSACNFLKMGSSNDDGQIPARSVQPLTHFASDRSCLRPPGPPRGGGRRRADFNYAGPKSFGDNTLIASADRPKAVLAHLRSPTGFTLPGPQSNFKFFFKALARCCKSTAQVVDLATPLSPSCLPFPEACGPDAPPRSPRRSSRYWQRLRAYRILNEMFSYFSFLELGCPKVGSRVAFLERPIFHPGIRPAALRLVGEVAAFSRLNPQTELSSGRLSLIQALRRAQSSANAYGQNFPKLDPETPAVWLDPQLMAIPKSGGGVNPLDFLSSEQSRQLLCTEPLSIPSEGCPPPLPQGAQGRRGCSYGPFIGIGSCLYRSRGGVASGALFSPPYPYQYRLWTILAKGCG